MPMRLKIGSYIIDAAESGSTSTTAGVRLLMDSPSVKWSEDRFGMEIVFPAQVTAASAAALKTAVEAVRNAAVKTVNADIVLERTSGTTLFSWTVSDNVFSRIMGNVEAEAGALDGNTDTHVALLVLTFRAERLGVAAGTAGDAAGALDPLDWSIAFDANGRGACTVAGVFDTRLNAASFANGLRSTNRPAWMGTGWRFVTVAYGPSQQLNQVSPVPESAWSPCTVAVTFRMLPAAFAADSAFANVVDVSYTVHGEPRPPIAEGAGGFAGFNVLLSGSLQVKTDKDATYDANDTTSVAASTIESTARACVASILVDAAARIGVGITQLDDVALTVGGDTGEVSFSVVGVSDLPGGIMTWDESVSFSRQPLDEVIRGTNSRRVFQDPLGADWTITHSLTITGLSQPSYVPPAGIDLSTGWLPRPWTKEHVPPARSSNGTFIYSGRWQREWYWAGAGEPVVSIG